MELRPGLHRIDTRLNVRLLSVYVLVGSESALLFDTGVPGTITDHVLPYLERTGIDPALVRTVVISHGDQDHFGGIGDARSAFPGAVVLAHAADADLIDDRRCYDADRARPFRDAYGFDPDPSGARLAAAEVPQGRVDLRLTGPAVIDLGDRRVEVFPTPGHSHGSISLHDEANRAVLIADATLGTAIPDADGRPCFAPTYRYVDDYLETMMTLVQLDPDLLLTTHFPTFDRPSAHRFLGASAGFVVRLEELILDRLRSAPQSLTELMIGLNPVAGSWPVEGTESALAPPIAGHLEQLVARGRVERLDRSPVTFALTPEMTGV